MNFNRIKDDITIYGLFNIVVYIVGSFFLLPIIQTFLKVNISLLNYVIWYVWSIAYTIYALYVINKDKSKQSIIDKVTYNWFIKGGFSSYQNVFLLSELEPLYEYAMLGILVLVPVANKLSGKRKMEVVLSKVAIFHIISSLMLMDWEDLVVNYEFRSLDKGDVSTIK